MYEIQFNIYTNTPFIRWKYTELELELENIVKL